MRDHSSKFLIPALVLGALLAAGCAHQPVGPKPEPARVAQAFGLPGCEVSVPMQREEALAFADSIGIPELAKSAKWEQANSLLEQGSNIRRVRCQNGDNFFGVFRGTVLLLRFGSMLYNQASTPPNNSSKPTPLRGAA